MSATDGGVCDGSFKLLQNDNIQFSSTDLDSISQCTKHTMFTDQQVSLAGNRRKHVHMYTCCRHTLLSRQKYQYLFKYPAATQTLSLS